jgi:cellulose synthase/poly-beta-1,6-N-acetylglucosamine synthase-like glycosyltransferase
MASLILIICIFFLVIHVVLMETYRYWFFKVKRFTPANISPAVHFTVIIPARNEQEKIADCLSTIFGQRYPAHLFEVIVIDDYSTDNTAAIVRELQGQFSNLKLIQLEKLLHRKQLNSYKKKAIELAIQQATGEWIVTTDADCTAPTMWLSYFAGLIQQEEAVFIAAPVKFTNTGSFVSIFQCLDFMSLQGITAASVGAGFHSMCNGANLAYNKSVFNEVGGFKGIDDIASGDDMMLMHKIYVRYRKQVHFLFSEESVVETEPMTTWRAFFNQRIRWASKADKFDDKRIIAVLVFIYLFNLWFLLLPVIALWHVQVLWYWFGMLVAKALIELRFMVPVAKFFGETRLLWWFPIMQPFHIAYTIIAGWLGKFGKYSWKGRVVK